MNTAALDMDDCPACGVLVGEKCLSSRGWPLAQPHAERPFRFPQISVSHTKELANLMDDPLIQRLGMNLWTGLVEGRWSYDDLATPTGPKWGFTTRCLRYYKPRGKVRMIRVAGPARAVLAWVDVLSTLFEAEAE